MILALLLGVVPFVQTFADTAPPATDKPIGIHDAMHQLSMDENDCDGCASAHNCTTGSCACYQCGTCSVTILHEHLSIPHASLTPLIPPQHITQLSEHPFLLFRPPRA